MFDGLSEVVADELFDEDTNLDLSDEEEGTDNSDAYSNKDDDDDDVGKGQARKRPRGRYNAGRGSGNSNPIKVLKCENKYCDDFDRVFKYASAKDRHDRWEKYI